MSASSTSIPSNSGLYLAQTKGNSYLLLCNKLHKAKWHKIIRNIYYLTQLPCGRNFTTAQMSDSGLGSSRETAAKTWACIYLKVWLQTFSYDNTVRRNHFCLGDADENRKSVGSRQEGAASTSSSPLRSPSSPNLAEPNRQRTLADYSPWVRRRARHSLATKQQQSQVWFSEMLLQDHRADYWSQWYHAKGENSSGEGSSWGHVALRLSESFANSEL